MKTRSWLVVLCTLLSACAWLDRTLAGRSLAACPNLMDQYLVSQDDEAIEAFHRLDLSGQYEVYICSSQYVHPPAMGFVSAFAEGGERVAEFLVVQLASGVNDLTFRDIVRVFSEMRRQGTYDVGSESLFVRWLEARAEAISSPDWREYVITELIPELRM